MSKEDIQKDIGRRKGREGSLIKKGRKEREREKKRDGQRRSRKEKETKKE